MEYKYKKKNEKEQAEQNINRKAQRYVLYNQNCKLYGSIIG